MTNRPMIELSLADGERVRDEDVFDPIRNPELFAGVLWRRVFAFALDFVFLACLLVLAFFAACTIAILSLGLIWFGALLAIPVMGVIYDVAWIGGGRSATPGMSAFGLTTRSENGSRPDRWQALLSSVLFWISVPASSFLILLFAFFDKRSRLLHDVFSSTLVIRVPTIGA